MRYDAALKYVYALERRGIKLELDSLGRGLGRLGHPERHLRFVHVAGTNGKGSVSAMVASCLRAAGFRTGLFTSPHLHRWVERIQINGRPLSKTAAAAAISEVAEAFDAPRAPVLSFFETTFAAALVAFRNAETDIVVLETGLGGRLDATNVVVPEVSVITGVALDHQRYLGPTLARIALEKAGILKRGVPAISGVRDRSARAVVRTEAKRRRCPLKELDSDFGADGIADLWCGAHTLTDVELGLPGEHQHSNAALAYATLLELRAHGFDVPDRAIRHGLRAVRWPCRLEWLEGRPRVLLDAAHNPEGARALAKYLGEHRAPGPVVMLFGASGDKDTNSMVRALKPRADAMIFVEPPIAHSKDAGALASRHGGERAHSVRDALARARRRAGAKGTIVVAGSIFLVGAVRAMLLGLPEDPPIRM